MSDRPWWASLIGVAVGVGLSALIYGSLNRGRLRKDAGDAQLSCPLAAKIIATICVLIIVPLFAIAGPFLLAEAIDKVQSLWALFALLGFSAVGAALIPLSTYWFLDCWFARFELTPEGIVYRSPLGRRGRLLWRDVEDVRYAITMKWFRVRGGGQAVRVSAMRRGLDRFARAILANVPEARIERYSRETVVATAQGLPPDLAD